MISNVLIGLGVIALILIIKKVIDDKKDDEKEDKPVAQAPSIPDLPIGRWCYIDDASEGNDSNYAQDLLCTVALQISKNGTRPAFIGVSTTPNGVDKGHVVEIMTAAALNVPVLQGHSQYRAGESELGNAIIAETKKGIFTICLGGPAGDIEWAFKNGAHTHNVTCHALLRGTWNAEGDKGVPDHMREDMRSSANYVASVLGDRLHEIRRPDYYHLLHVENLPNGFKETTEFINRNRDLLAWDVANKNSIVSENARLNAQQAFSTHLLRMADVLATASSLGINLGDTASIFNGIQNGLDIMKDRIARGAVNTISYTASAEVAAPSISPVNRSTFNEATCKVYVHPEDGGSRNTLEFRQTATITSGSITADSYNIRHTKDGIWKGKLYKDGRYIDGADGVISFNRDDNTWYLYMFEYSLIGEFNRPKGVSYLPWVKSGDPIGLISSTSARNGAYDVSGQANERSNIHWLTA